MVSDNSNLSVNSILTLRAQSYRWQSSSTASAPLVGGCPSAPLVGGCPSAPLVEGCPSAPLVEGCPSVPLVGGCPSAPLVGGCPSAPLVGGCPSKCEYFFECQFQSTSRMQPNKREDIPPPPKFGGFSN